MSEPDPAPSPSWSRFAQLCAWSNMALAVLALIGWLSGRLILAQLASSYIPTAQSTAVVYLIISVGLLAYLRLRGQRTGRRTAIASAALCLVIVSLILLKYLGVLQVEPEHWLFSTSKTLNGAPLGHMSSITAVALLLAGLGLLALSSDGQPWRNVGAVLSVCVTGISIVILIGYSFGTPLLYGSGNVPVSLPSGISLLLISLGLLGAADPRTWPLRLVVGSSTRVRVARAFLPGILVILLAEGLLSHFLVIYAGWSIFLAGTLTTLFSILIAIGAVPFAANRVGEHLERAVEALREREHQLQALVGSLDDIVFEYDDDGTYLNIWARDESLLARPVAEMLGRRIPEILGEEIGRPMLEAVQRVVASGQHEDFEYALEIRDSRHWFLGSISPVLGPDGRFGTACVVVHEDTARKQAEEALQESEARYRAVAESANDAIISSDRQGRIVGWNKAAETIFGYATAEAIGQPVSLLMPAAAQGAFHVGMMHMAISGESQVSGKSTEGLGRRKDGTEFPLDMSLSAWHVGGEFFYTALVRDITERKQAEFRLTAERNLLRTLIDQLPDNIFVKDLDGRVIVDNAAHRSLLGASSLDEVVGKTDFDFFAGSLAASYDADEKEIIRSGKALINQEEPTVDRDGKQRWLLTTKLPWRDHQGKIAGIVEVNRDITDRQQAQTLQEAVYRIAAAAETAGSLDDLYQDIHEIISSVMPAENFYITIYDEAEDLLRFPYFRDLQDQPFIEGIQPGKGLTAYVLRTGKSLLCTQAVHDELERRGEVRLLGVPSAIWLGVPLIAAGKTIGAMVVQHYSDPKAYGEREQHMLEFVSTQVALTINRKRAEDELRRAKDALEATHLEVKRSLAREEILARTDGLTGLRNRFNFEELAAREFRVAVRHLRALAIILLDADGLKEINDTLGHAAGDKALAHIARTALAHTRDTDVLARYGGDEFILLLPETTSQQAQLIAERIRARVGSAPIGNGGRPIAVTLSIGIAELRREPMDANVDQVVQRADNALYQAKAEGRNRTVVLDPGTEGKSHTGQAPDGSQR